MLLAKEWAKTKNPSILELKAALDVAKDRVSEIEEIIARRQQVDANVIMRKLWLETIDEIKYAMTDAALEIGEELRIRRKRKKAKRTDETKVFE